MSEHSTERAQAALAFYGPLMLSPCNARRVGWEDPVAHELRLQAIVESLAPLPRLSSLIDVGCGEGALFSLVRQAGFEGRYQGEDILDGMINRAQETHPAGDFLLTDSLERTEEADGVVCCGTLNTATTGGHLESLTHLWSRAREVLVVAVHPLVRRRVYVAVGVFDDYAITTCEKR